MMTYREMLSLRSMSDSLIAQLTGFSESVVARDRVRLNPAASEKDLAMELCDLHGKRELPKAGTRLAVYADLVEARVFARECEQTVEEWLTHDDVKDDPTWQRALALHRELTNH